MLVHIIRGVDKNLVTKKGCLIGDASSFKNF
jgi:hypothetical protein